MTTNAQGSISGVTTGEAGLLATFYIPCDKAPVQLLQDRFCQAFRLVPESPGTKALDRWSDPTGKEAFLVRIEPTAGSPVTYDTTILQLALNAPDGADSPWETTREKLEKSIWPAADLDDERLWNAAGLGGILGYTLTYQAVLNPGFGAGEVFRELRPTVRRLYSSRSLYPVAQTDVAGGRMWLLHTADQGHGPAAATVYVALSPSKAERAFTKVFSGPGAPLLMPDLIAHKGYHQKREYSGGKQQKYEKYLDDFQKTTGRLLTDLKEQESVASDKLLGDLTRDYGELIEMVWDLDNLRISMAQQSYNFVQQSNDYGRSSAAMKDNNLLDYHRDRIKAANSELELMVTEGRHGLEAANPVLRMAQLRTDKAQESRQIRIEAWLAAAALALTLPHLLDHEATRALLEATRSLLWLIGLNVTATEPGPIFVLAAQVAIILPVAFLLWLRVKRSLSKPRGLDKWVPK